MSEGFSNPVSNAIGTLVRKALQSLGFVSGSSGWQIQRDGDAEFNGVQLRGNLVLGPSATTGPRIILGNSIPSVLSTWAISHGFVISVVLLKYWNNTDFEWNAVGQIGGQASAFAGTYDTVNGVYLVQQTVTTPSNVQYLLGNQNVNAFPLINRISNTNISAQNADVTGWYQLNAVVPGTAINVTNIEIWNSMGLQNAWTNFGPPFVGAFYRAVPSPAGNVQIIGTVQNGTSTPGTVLANLPAPYRPNERQRVPCYAFGAGFNLTTETPAIDIDPSGNLILVGTTNAAILTFNNFYDRFI